MNKKLKFLILITTCYFSFNSNSFGASGVNDGSPNNITNSSSQLNSSSKNLLQNTFGTGISMGVRFNLVEDIFTDLDENSKVNDHIFTEIEAFGNQFFSGEIKQNFGGRVNLGYEIKGIRIYSSGGYTLSSVNYRENSNNKQKFNVSAPFFGIGVGYDITKNIGIRLNSMIYNFDFKPKNSQYQNVEFDAITMNLGLAVHF